MTNTTGRRTQVQAVDDLAEQLRLSNLLAALALPVNALEHETKVTPASAARVARKNALRAEARKLLGIEEVSDADHA